MIASAKDQTVEKPLTSTMEDYLEAIFDLDTEKKVVRVKDIAKRLDVKMPTVTSMLRSLNDKGLINYEKYEYVALTDTGADVGREMRRRHQALFRFLTTILKIDVKTADAEACKMEHKLSINTLESLTDFMEFIQTCPRTGGSWLHYFEKYRNIGHRPEECNGCAEVICCDLDPKDLKCNRMPA
ncbi:MAG: metal-dependent transcriptional regulator [Deltaproteobacteria bacterium]|nr:metal-dependent transcriptional regulator [Deltaproteobacteria bacterium]